MDPNRYTEVASRASERYQAVLTTFRGMLSSFLIEPFSVRKADELRANAVEVGRMYFRSESSIITDELNRTAQDALRTARADFGVSPTSDIPEALSAFLTQHIAYLDSELRAQLSRDVEMLVRRYREYALETHLAETSNSYSRSAVTAGHSRFYFRDRMGRLYPSQKFVRSVWRLALVTVGAEFFALEAADLGADAVEVVHPDPHSSQNGLIISLNGHTSPSFLEIRDEVFHPQSQVTLKVVDVQA